MQVLMFYIINYMKKDSSRHIDTFKIIGHNLRNIRETKNISQEELAFKINSARNYIGCIERGEKFPSVAILKDISNALDCEFQKLFEGA